MCLRCFRSALGPVYLSAAELIAVRTNLTQLLLACADEPLRTSGERDPLPTVLAVGTEASKKLREGVFSAHPVVLRHHLGVSLLSSLKAWFTLY